MIKKKSKQPKHNSTQLKTEPNKYTVYIYNYK